MSNVEAQRLVEGLIEDVELGTLGHDFIEQTGFGRALLTFAEAAHTTRSDIYQYRLTDHIVKMLKSIKTIERSFDNAMVLATKIRSDANQEVLPYDQQ